MKKNIHPDMKPVIFVDESTGEEIRSYSTITSNETKEIDGVNYYVVRMDITALSHPYFTGEMRFVDSQGRVDKFMQKMKKAEAVKKNKPKKKHVKKQTEVKSYQEILREQQAKIRTSQKKVA
jgi:large subunit ribosomal protein L31